MKLISDQKKVIKVFFKRSKDWKKSFSADRVPHHIVTVSTNDRSLPNHPNSKYNKRILLLNPPASAVEGIKSVPSVCVCVCVRMCVC